MRSVWKGHVRFSLINMPVKLYLGVDREEERGLEFHQYHEGCNGNVGYEKKCKKCGKALTMDEIIRGHEHTEGHVVKISDTDLEKIHLESTKIIDIEAFVPKEQIPVAYYEKPYMVGPDGEVAYNSYALMVESIKQSGKVGIGKITIKGKEEPVALAVDGTTLMLYALRYPAELRKPAQVPNLEKVKSASQPQVALALDLVNSMTKNFADIELKNKYQSALRELVQAKIEGKEVESLPDAPPAPIMDMMALLQASIAAARGTAGTSATKEPTVTQEVNTESAQDQAKKAARKARRQARKNTAA